MAEELRLILLGRPRIMCNEAPVTGFVSNKAQALLCYLAVTGRSHSREALAGLLWGDMPEAHARNNLRVVLSNLRRLVAPHLIITRQTVAFNQEHPYWLDVQVFESQVGEGLRVGSSNLQPLSLHAAVELYQGDFLEGFHVRAAVAFEDWVLGQRERLRQLMLQALHTLAGYHTARGVYAAAMEYTTRLLALEPWQEEAHQQLMLLLALTGRRSEALGQYARCRRLLARELGVEPLEETTALYRRILAGAEKSAQVPSAPSVPSLPFVGREEEHAQLMAAWGQARRGQGKLTLIEGEAGMGKTRLAEEVLRYIEAQGATLLRGRCYEFGATVAYQPIAEALRAVLRQGDEGDWQIENGDVPKETSGKVKKKKGVDQDGLYRSPFSLFPFFPFSLSPVWLAEVARLLPELRDRLPKLPAPVEVSGEAARQRLFEAVARCLQALVSGQRSAVVGRSPALSAVEESSVVFLDDLHWIDPTTVDLLHYLIRRLVDAPIWFLGAYRREEMDLDHPLLLMRRALSRDGRVALVRLGPLEPRDIACGVHGLPGLEEAGATRLGEYLTRESEGNPFIFTELLHDLADRRCLHLSAEGQGWWLAPDWSGSPTDPEVPFAVREVVLGRVARLPARSRDLLHLAAVIGQEFDLPLLRMAAGDDAPAVDESVGDWLARRLVKLEGGGGKGEKGKREKGKKGKKGETRGDTFPSSSYDFAHDMIRAVVYQAAGETRRRVLHRRVGDAVEGLHAGRLKPVYEQLAYHYEQAGAVDKAVTYLPLAGAKAAAVYANQEALNYYARALALLAESDERRWEVLLRQAEILRRVGEYEKAIAACRQVVGSGRDPSTGSGPALWQVRAANQLSELYRARRDYEAARAWAQAAYRLATAAEEETENGSGRSPRSGQSSRSGRSPTEPGGARSGNRPPQRWGHGQETGPSEGRLSARERARAKQVLGEVEREQGNLDLAQRLFEEALALHRVLRRSEACPGPGVSPERLGGDPDAGPVEGADQRGMADCLNGLGHIFSARGHYGAARQRFEEALAIFRALGDRQSEATCLRTIGITHWRQGVNDAAHQAFAASLDICRAIGDRQGEAHCLNDLGLAYIVQRAYDETRRCWEESVALFRALGLEKRAAFSLHNLGILHMNQGAYAAARRCLEESLAIDRAVGAKSAQALDLGWLGHLHLLRGEYDDARHCLEAALGLDREVGGSEEEVWHLAWRGAVAYETGDLDRAQEYLQEAIQRAGERGADLKLQEVYQRLAEVHLAQRNGEAALTAARQALAEAEAVGEHAAGACCAVLGAVYGSGLIKDAQDPVPHFERALALLRDENPFNYGVALRQYGAYLVCAGDRAQGTAYLQAAQDIFEDIGAQGELARVNRLLDE